MRSRRLSITCGSPAWSRAAAAVLLFTILGAPSARAVAQPNESAPDPIILLTVRSLQQTLGPKFNRELGVQVGSIMQENHARLRECRTAWLKEMAGATGVGQDKIESSLNRPGPGPEPDKPEAVRGTLELLAGKALSPSQVKGLEAAFKKRNECLGDARRTLLTKAEAATGLSTDNLQVILNKANETSQSTEVDASVLGPIAQLLLVVLVFVALTALGSVLPRFALETQARGRAALAAGVLVWGLQHLLLIGFVSSFVQVGPWARPLVGLAFLSLLTSVLVAVPRTSRFACGVVTLAFAATIVGDLLRIGVSFQGGNVLSGIPAIIAGARNVLPHLAMLGWAVWFGVRKPASTGS